jgi:hypothetical protein
MFRLPGKVLNDLLEAARDAARQFQPPIPAVQPAARHVSERELEEAVVEIFHGLRRERHWTTGLVPIHQIRDAIRQRFGESAATHEIFDAAVLRLRDVGEFRLVPITNLSRASDLQLTGSIPGVGETLFFIEALHEPVAR